jgi:hypothetical protein
VDAVSWAQVASPLVSAAGIAAVVVWAVGERRRNDRRAQQDGWEAYRVLQEDRRHARETASARYQVDLVQRVAIAFERHQAGASYAAAECRALLLGIEQRLPVTRFVYLGKAAWQPDDASRIQAIAAFYNLPVGPDLARLELRHELQGSQLTVYTSNGAAETHELPPPTMAVTDAGPRHLTFRLKRAGRHARE